MKLQALIFRVNFEIVKIDRAGFKFRLHKDQHDTAGNGARRRWHVTLGLVPLTINSGLLFCVDGTNFSPFQNPTIFSQTFHSQDTKIFGALNRCVLWRSTKNGSVKDGSCLNVEAAAPDRSRRSAHSVGQLYEEPPPARPIPSQAMA